MDTIKIKANENTPAPKEEQRAEWVSKLRYAKSFLAKLYLSDRDLKDAYCALFNKFTACEGVSAKTGFDGVTFYYKRKALAKISLTGKTLFAYFATDPSKYQEGRYRLIDVSSIKRYLRLPAKLRIKSSRALRHALRIADDIIKEWDLKEKAIPLPPVTAKDFPTETLSNLLSRGLIRQMGINNDSKKSRENLIFVERTADVGSENADGVTTNESEIFADTAATTVALTERHPGYEAILNSFTEEGDIRLVKQSVINSIGRSSSVSSMK